MAYENNTLEKYAEKRVTIYSFPSTHPVSLLSKMLLEHSHNVESGLVGKYEFSTDSTSIRVDTDIGPTRCTCLSFSRDRWQRFFFLLSKSSLFPSVKSDQDVSGSVTMLVMG